MQVQHPAALIEPTFLERRQGFLAAGEVVICAGARSAGLACEDFTGWMGHRPTPPDTVPILSASARTKGLFYATGHGHLGLTHAATTARLMGDLITGARPPVDLRPCRVNRF